jgi:hypothetical protein
MGGANGFLDVINPPARLIAFPKSYRDPKITLRTYGLRDDLIAGFGHGLSSRLF